LEFNVPFQHKYGYIRDERAFVLSFLDDIESFAVFKRLRCKSAMNSRSIVTRC